MPVRKTVPLSIVAETILPHLLQSLKQREATTETQALTEAVTKGLIAMLPRAWSADEHQYGGLPLDQVVEELKHLLSPLLAFMAEHDALAALLKPYLSLMNTSHGVGADTAGSVSDDDGRTNGLDSATQQSIASAMSDFGNLGFSMDFDTDDEDS